MGLIRQNMIERAAGVTPLVLQLGSSESARVKRIWYEPAAAALEAIRVFIDRREVLHFAAPAMWRLLSDMYVGGYTSIAGALHRIGLWPVIPIGKGEALTITGGAANSYLTVVYDLYDGEDVNPAEPNGSKADRYRLFQIVSNAGVLAAAGDLALNQSDLDSLFPSFPGGHDVPAGSTMELIGLFGTAASKGTGAANGEYTTALKLLKDREDLLDRDLVGLPFRGDPAFVGASVEYETLVGPIRAGVQYMEPRLYLFDPPVEFPGGSELNVFATIARTGAGADFAAGEVKLGMLFDVLRSA